jgi:rhodanese-related sulfurtransferase
MFALSRAKLFTSLAVMGLLLTGCGTFGPTISDASLQYVEPQQLQKWRQTDQPPVVLMDVRAAAAYATGHIQGAVHFPLPRIQPNDARLEKKRLVVYGRDSQDPIAPAAAKKLMSQGYREVYVLRGGLEAYQDARAGSGSQDELPASTQPPQS